MPGAEHDTPERRRGFSVAELLRDEAAGGVVLLIATVVALVWANSPWQDAYRDVAGGGVRTWVDEGLMAVFFLVVGLEIKRELVRGELRDPRTAAVPVIAAVGGMALPAVIYAAWNAGQPGAHGWGIPMATDIAFAVGVVALAGARVVPSLRLFLLTLAVVDDVGAIVVIVVAYSTDVDLRALALAAVLLAGYAVVRDATAHWVPVLVVFSVAVWAAVYQSGVHATIAGIAVALLVPVDRLGRLEDALVPWSSFAVVPLFALVNAGVTFRAGALDADGAARVVVGIAVGLVVGKAIGITGAAWLAVRLGVGRLPVGATWPRLFAVATVAGIGFTVSLFVAGLAFSPGSALDDAAKIGVLAGSGTSAVLGAVLLTAGRAARRPR